MEKVRRIYFSENETLRRGEGSRHEHVAGAGLEMAIDPDTGVVCVRTAEFTRLYSPAAWRYVEVEEAKGKAQK